LAFVFTNTFPNPESRPTFEEIEVIHSLGHLHMFRGATLEMSRAFVPGALTSAGEVNKISDRGALFSCTLPRFRVHTHGRSTAGTARAVEIWG